MPLNAQKRAYNRAARGGIDDISTLRAIACAPFKAASRAFLQSAVDDTFARVPMRVRFSCGMGDFVRHGRRRSHERQETE